MKPGHSLIIAVGAFALGFGFSHLIHLDRNIKLRAAMDELFESDQKLKESDKELKLEMEKGLALFASYTNQLTEFSNWKIRILQEAWTERWNRKLADPDFRAGVRYGILAHCQAPHEQDSEILTLSASNLWWRTWNGMTNSHVITNQWSRIEVKHAGN